MESRNNLLLPRENIEKQLRSCEGYRRNNPWWAGRSYRIALTCLSAMDARDAAEARVRELEAAASGFQMLHELDVARRAETINALKAFDAKNKELEAMVADRGRERDAAQEAAGSAERRLRELEAQSAAMRGTLTSLAAWLEAGAPVDDMLEVEEWRSVCVSALSSDAGRALLERVEALERVADVARYACDEDIDKAISALDALEAKR